jgi:TolB protein
MKNVVAAALFVALCMAGAAQAAFPGSNGKLVFRSNRTGNADIYTSNADGTNRVNLTRNPAEDVDPRWSPDGLRIVFASNRTGLFQIYTMNGDGSNLRQITGLAAGDAHRPSWTPGGQILFQSDAANPGNSRDLYLVNADGTGLKNLTSSTSDEFSAAAAPRGNRLAFTSNADAGLYHLYVRSGSATPKEITSGNVADIQANWSPSGNDLVFARFDPSFSTSDLYVVHSDGTGLRQLTSTPGVEEVEPAWSPDGTKIVYHACNLPDFSNCVIDTINPDGTGTAQVTKTFTAPFVDDFSSTPLDDFWNVFPVGTGPTIQQANGRLEITMPGSTILDPVSGFANPSVFSQCNLRGDFDMQVDYNLVQWPSPDQVNPLFNEGNFVNGNYVSSNGMFLSKFGLSSNFDDGQPAAFVPNVPPQGTLRLKRVGPTLTASYNVDGTWQTLQVRSGSLVADESDAALSVFSNALPGSHGDVLVAYDNFRVNSGTFACPTWWDDNAPDWQPS